MSYFPKNNNNKGRGGSGRKSGGAYRGSTFSSRNSSQFDVRGGQQYHQKAPEPPEHFGKY
ncbi:hypothetical protein HZS_6719 [Henneguya salminicola]|nr:hypothetical protein HZS_6719 [Henneguya salminicola]